MTEYVYRFRSLDSLLGEHQELENQEIYLSTLEHLNDPMEGFTNLFWSGDEIVWINLIKHYLLCLDRACIQFIVLGNQKDIDLRSLPIFATEFYLQTPQWKDLYKNICDTFFATSAVPEYVQGLCSRARPIHRDELCYHLTLLHCHALNAIFTVYKSIGMNIDARDGETFRELCEKAPVKPEIFDFEGTNPDVARVDQWYASAKGGLEQALLTAKYNNPGFAANHNTALIMGEFPIQYVKLLEKPVHGDWYTACFSKNFVNSSMWGHYADKHKGVCLKFNSGKDREKPSLALNYIGRRPGHKTEFGAIANIPSCYVNHQLHQVVYQKTYPEIDFFRSLGCLNNVTLDWWYTDGNGNKSSCASHIYDNEDEWREKYWAELLKIQTTKLEDWAYEEEYRLVLSPLETDLSEPSTRKFKYRFSDLKGIIFGINTPETDKLAIIRLIHEKCRKERRKEFEFHQAYYAKATGRIDAAPLNITF
jgi:Protein of unknown function (DUF2971)